MNKQAVLYTPGSNDECYTPDYAVRALLPHLPPPPLLIWCPFDLSSSAFVRVLQAAGYYVVASHISEGLDYYNYSPECWDMMISNPPYTNKAAIFRRALGFGKPFALLMTLTWLNDATPKRLFREANRPLELLMFEERIHYLGQSGKVTFSSAYYCSGVLPTQIVLSSVKPYK